MLSRLADRGRLHGRLLALALTVLAPGALALAQDARVPREPRAASTDEPTGAPELAEDARRAIEVALRRLKESQQDSGRWLASGTTYDMSVTALAGLAFLAHGEEPGRGDYGAVLEKAIDFILRSQSRFDNDPHLNGLFFDRPEMDERNRVMHGHGFALLFLAEAYGQASRPELRERIHKALVKGVKLTERTQSPEGGWYYLPVGLDLTRDEGSVTITQIQGLRSARNAGIVVSKATIDRAVDYIRKSQIPAGEHAGGVRYTSKYGEPSAALTAAGIACYYGAGEYNSPGIELGFQYLARNMNWDDHQKFWSYTHFYAVQAYHQRGGPDWTTYFARLQRELLGGRNAKSGEWDDPFAGKVFATACAVLCLEVPLRYLPIFQR